MNRLKKLLATESSEDYKKVAKEVQKTLNMAKTNLKKQMNKYAQEDAPAAAVDSLKTVQSELLDTIKKI